MKITKPVTIAIGLTFDRDRIATYLEDEEQLQKDLFSGFVDNIAEITEIVKERIFNEQNA